MDAFLTEIEHRDPKIRLNAINNIELFVKDVGKEMTVSSLLPALKCVLEDEDEQLAALAEQLSKFPQHLPEDKSIHLLDFVEALCKTEETLVRDKACKAAFDVAEHINDSDLQTYFIPMYKRLADEDWFTSKTSACSISAIAFSRSSEETQKELLAIYKNFCCDDTPMVRRAAATHLKSVIPHLSTALIVEQVIDIIKAFSKDEQDSVRLLVANVVLALAKTLKEKAPEQRQLVVPIISGCASDKSWRVRYMIGNVFSEIVELLEKDIIKESLVSVFVALLNDTEAEVRAVVAEKVSVVAVCISVDSVARLLLPTVKVLAIDEAVPVREALASDITLMAPQFGSDGTKEHLIPLFLVMLKDSVPEVRLNVMSKLDQIADAIGFDNLSNYLIPAIVELAEDKHWRVRLAVIEFMPRLARTLDLEFFSSKLGPLCVNWLSDPVFRIREKSTENLKNLVEILGVEYYKKHMHPKILEISKDSNYLYRLVVLFAVARVATVLPIEFVKSDLIKIVLNLADDGAANVRLNVGLALQSLLPLVKDNKDLVAVQIKPLLAKLMEDNDMDVKFNASIANDLLN